MGKIKLNAQKIIIQCIAGYRYFISPLLGENCRFYPSCSHYTLVAIEQYGLVRGLLLAMKRILRCHPWCAGGYDPVPGQK